MISVQDILNNARTHNIRKDLEKNLVNNNINGNDAHGKLVVFYVPQIESSPSSTTRLINLGSIVDEFSKLDAKLLGIYENSDFRSRI